MLDLSVCGYGPRSPPVASPGWYPRRCRQIAVLFRRSRFQRPGARRAWGRSLCPLLDGPRLRRQPSGYLPKFDRRNQRSATDVDWMEKAAADQAIDGGAPDAQHFRRVHHIYELLLHGAFLSFRLDGGNAALVPQSTEQSI